jgi:hypothetical protein
MHVPVTTTTITTTITTTTVCATITSHHHHHHHPSLCVRACLAYAWTHGVDAHDWMPGLPDEDVPAGRLRVPCLKYWHAARACAYAWTHGVDAHDWMPGLPDAVFLGSSCWILRALAQVRFSLAHFCIFSGVDSGIQLAILLVCFVRQVLPRRRHHQCNGDSAFCFQWAP